MVFEWSRDRDCVREKDRDVQSVETLFDEMKQQWNFKPDIPLYNTMIQFYTYIVQNWEKALYYFSELMRANTHPTVHTKCQYLV